MMTASLRPNCPLQLTTPQSWWRRTGRNLLIFPVCHQLPESSLGQHILQALWAFTQHINSLTKSPVHLSALPVHHFSQPRPPNKRPRQAAPTCEPVGSKGRLEKVLDIWRPVMERGRLSRSSCFMRALQWPFVSP